MTEHQKLSDRLAALLPLLTLIICISQPILDVLSYWQRELDFPNIFTMTLRLFILLSGVLIGYLVTDRKWIYHIFGMIVALYLIGHIAACMANEGGYLDWVTDLSDQARTLLLPLTALTFITFLRRNPETMSAMKRAVVINFLIIAFVELLSTVTGTDPHTYEAKAQGVRGWFIWTSPQSAILSLVCPISISWVTERYPKRILPTVVISLLTFGALFFFGTRLAVFTLAGVGLGLPLCLILIDHKHVGQAAAIFLCALAYCCLIPIHSPMLNNRIELGENAVAKQQRIDQAIEQTGIQVSPEGTRDLRVIETAYHYNLQGMIDRFGIKRVAELYDFTLNADEICDDRIMKKNFCKLLMEDADSHSMLPSLFGLEISRTRMEFTQVYQFETDSWEETAEAYDPENDFSGIYYLCGICGLSLMIGFLAYFGIRAGVALVKYRQAVFNLAFASFSGAYLIALIYAYNTASVLRRNNASFYFALILAALWYLSRPPVEKGE